VNDDQVRNVLLHLSVRICEESGLDFVELNDAMKAEHFGEGDNCVELIARSFGRLIRSKLDGV
jgi:hypothetical protein